MNKHFTIEPLSDEWSLYTSLCLIFMLFILWAGRALSEPGKNTLRFLMGICCLISVIMIHPYLHSEGLWSAQESLPLHLCEVSEIIAAFVLLMPNQRLFEILSYWGIPGGIHSILTPELLHSGEDTLLVLHYYFQHTAIVLVPVFLMIAYGMRLSRFSWLKIFFITNLYLLFAGAANYLIGSNYMFLAQKPIAENPLLIGDWPWYIIIVDLAGLLHFYIVYLFGKPAAVKYFVKQERQFS